MHCELINPLLCCVACGAGMVCEASTLAINMTSVPSYIKKGKAFGLRGTITSNYKITDVDSYIINTVGGKRIQSQSDNCYANSLNVRYLNANKLSFGKLNAGSYILKIVAKDTSGKTITYNCSFVVHN